MFHEPRSRLTTGLSISTLLLLAVGLAGCSTPRAEDAFGPEPAIHLAATLISPTDVALEWKDDATDAAGRVVEFATDPNGEYSTIQFLPPHQTRFMHPDLMPDTRFYYRVRAFYGPASSPVEVTLPEPPSGEDIEEDDHGWAYPRTVAAGAVAKRPIRQAATAAEAAPTDLKATVMHSTGIRFTWMDRATDEDGYLLEVRPEGASEYGVAAVLDPDINSFGLITLPNEKKAAFRVRAFYYGKPSNLAHQTTGPEPSR